MAPHTIAGSHPRRDVSPRRDRPRPTWRSIPGRPRLRAPSGRGMPGTAPQDTTPVAARLATCRGNTFGPAIRFARRTLAGEKSVPCTRHAALHLSLGARFVNPWHVQGLNPPLVRDVQSTAALLQGASQTPLVRRPTVSSSRSALTGADVLWTLLQSGPWQPS